MRPRIDARAFGSDTIEGQKIKNDVILQFDGPIQKRKKKLIPTPEVIKAWNAAGEKVVDLFHVTC